LGVLQRNKNFQTPLEQVNNRFLLLCPFFTKKEIFKKFTEFFQQYANMHPMYSMLYTANLDLCDYVLFSQVRSNMQLQKEVKSNPKKPSRKKVCCPQNTFVKKDVKSKWPRNGCDGRLNKTIQVNLCCLLHVSLRFGTKFT